ncbi:hypothetical protein C2S53_000871 [Perilla frutescens var. hirtella]|uniref:Uncharacterized protein n=1 Tax=Perilla frutescens var. hirtella TaxID=608512 RepID=A0AAD4JJT7_PERFH|nr:hypothetical protein C2S53_000871 [Perilla frutescens var. hirtella]
MQWKGMKLLKYLVSVSRLIYEQVIRYLKGICIKVYFLICEPSLPEIKPIVPVGYLNWLDNDTKCSYVFGSAVQELVQEYSLNSLDMPTVGQNGN